MVTTPLNDRLNATRKAIRVALATLVVVILGWAPQAGLSGGDHAPPSPPSRPLARPPDPQAHPAPHQASSAPAREG